MYHASQTLDGIVVAMLTFLMAFTEACRQCWRAFRFCIIESEMQGVAT